MGGAAERWLRDWLRAGAGGGVCLTRETRGKVGVRAEGEGPVVQRVVRLSEGRGKRAAGGTAKTGRGCTPGYGAARCVWGQRRRGPWCDS